MLCFPVDHGLTIDGCRLYEISCPCILIKADLSYGIKHKLVVYLPCTFLFLHISNKANIFLLFVLRDFFQKK